MNIFVFEIFVASFAGQLERRRGGLEERSLQTVNGMVLHVLLVHRRSRVTCSDMTWTVPNLNGLEAKKDD